MKVDKTFWERNPSVVAKDLVYRPILQFYGTKNVKIHGILTEVDAYNSPIIEKDDHLFTQEPGKIGIFGSRRGAIPVITAHIKGGKGLITLRELIRGEERFGPTDIAGLLHFDDLSGQVVGKESGLYFGETGIELASEDLKIVNDLPNEGPQNRVAYYRLARK